MKSKEYRTLYATLRAIEMSGATVHVRYPYQPGRSVVGTLKRKFAKVSVTSIYTGNTVRFWPHQIFGIEFTVMNWSEQRCGAIIHMNDERKRISYP